MRNAFYSLCPIAKGRAHYWTIYLSLDAMQAAGEPDAKGKAPSLAAAEQAAREAIRARQPDWRCQVVRTLDRYAETQAVIDGQTVFQRPQRRRESIFDKWRREQRQRSDFQSRFDAWAKAPPTPRTLPTPPCFAVLGLTRGATAADIRAAFRRLALDAHPDRGGSHDDFCRLNAAYQEATKIVETGCEIVRVYV